MSGFSLFEQGEKDGDWEGWEREGEGGGGGGGGEEELEAGAVEGEEGGVGGQGESLT